MDRAEEYFKVSANNVNVQSPIVEYPNPKYVYNILTKEALPFSYSMGSKYKYACKKIFSTYRVNLNTM